MTKELVQTASSAVPGVEGKLIQMLDALQDGAVKVGEQVVKYSPDIADAALWVVRIEGIQALVIAAVGLLMSLIAWKLGGKMWRFYKDIDEEGHPFVMVPSACYSVSVLVAIFSTFDLVKIWTWIAIFQPKLWLAKQIVGAALR